MKPVYAALAGVCFVAVMVWPADAWPFAVFGLGIVIDA